MTLHGDTKTHQESPISNQFFLTSGSIIGAEHVRLGRNNQDGIALSVSDAAIVAVVTDGCSAGRYSEVGARLAATWLAEWSPLYLADDGAGIEARTEELAQGLTDYLRQIAFGLRPAPDALPHTVADLLLFGFIAVMVTADHTLIFGVGDGLYQVGDTLVSIDPGPDNAPPYVGYRLLRPGSINLSERRLSPRIHWSGDTASVHDLLIGSDGVADLEPADLSGFLTDPVYLKNPLLVQRKLNVLTRNRRLHDDTSLVVIRRRPNS